MNAGSVIASSGCYIRAQLVLLKMKEKKRNEIELHTNYCSGVGIHNETVFVIFLS